MKCLNFVFIGHIYQRACASLSQDSYLKSTEHLISHWYAYNIPYVNACSKNIFKLSAAALELLGGGQGSLFAVGYAMQAPVLASRRSQTSGWGAQPPTLAAIHLQLIVGRRSWCKIEGRYTCIPSNISNGAAGKSF